VKKATGLGITELFLTNRVALSAKRWLSGYAR